MFYLLIALCLLIFLLYVKGNKNKTDNRNSYRETTTIAKNEKQSDCFTESATPLQSNVDVPEKWEDGPFEIITYEEHEGCFEADKLQKMYAYLSTKGAVSTYIPVYVDQAASKILISVDRYNRYIDTFNQCTILLREANGIKKFEVSLSGIRVEKDIIGNNEHSSYSSTIAKNDPDPAERNSLTEEGPSNLFKKANKLIINPHKEEVLLPLAYKIIGDNPDQDTWLEEWKQLIDYALPNTEVDTPDNYEWADALGYSIKHKLNHQEQYDVCEALLHYPGKLTELQQCWVLEVLKWLFHDSNWAYRDNYLDIDYEYLCKKTKTKEIFMQCIGEFPGLNAFLAVYALRKCDINSLHDLLSAYLLLDQNARIEFFSQMNRALDGAIDLILSHSVAELSAAKEEFALIDNQRTIEIETGHPFYQIESCLKYGILTKIALQEIECGIIWKNEEEMLKENDMWVSFIYPNGKHGDIDMAIATAYGKEIKNENGLIHSVLFESKDFKYVELIANQIIYFNRPEQYPKLVANNRRAYRLLSKYNNYQYLRELYYDSNGLFNKSSLRDKAGNVYRSATKRTTVEERNRIYSELIKKGEATSGWKSEQQVYALVSQRYPDAVFQYHTGWLGMQSLDIFIPSLSVGIEYQGQQHYEAIDYFGGIEKFEAQVAADTKKRQLCEENGVKLIYWKYTEPITVEMLNSKMRIVKC